VNISIELTDIIVWTDGNEIDLAKKHPISIMKSLVKYRKALKDSYPNDHLILLTNKDFRNYRNAFGGAYDVGMICQEDSVSYAIYKKSHESKIGEAMAHEIAHIIGIYDDSFWCPGTDFVMSPFQLSTRQRTWSHCSIEAFELNLENRGNSHCLFEKPRK
jgi:hypothetical protein